MALRGVVLILVLCIVTHSGGYTLHSKREANEEEECYIENVALIGGDLPKSRSGEGIKTSNIQECVLKCQSESDCYYWTFVEELHLNCYLKGKNGGSDRDMDGAVTGWMKDNCVYPNGLKTQNIKRILGLSQAEEEPTGCAYDDIAFLGYDLAKSDGGEGITTETFEDCGRKCQETSSCKAWNFVKKWKVNCYLKSKLGEKTDLEGAVSGSLLPCDAEEGAELPGKSNEKFTIQGDECRFFETNFLGGDLSKEDGGHGIETASADECSKECRQRPGCKYWTNVKKWKVSCYLKSRLGEKSDFEGGESGTFGENCDNELNSKIESEVQLESSGPVKDGAGCRFPGINFLAGDLPKEKGGHGIESLSADDCKDQCSLRRTCQFWTYVSEWKVNCYLKESKGPSQELHGATSGSLLIPCEESAVEEDLSCLEDERTNDHECSYGNTNFNGADLPESHGGLGITTSSDEECRKECFKRLYCKHWTRINGWKVDCYLKTNRVKAESKEGATSGSVGLPCNKTATLIQNNPSLTTSKPLTQRANNKVCVYKGISYQGGDLQDPDVGKGLTTSEHQECADECTKRSACNYWTFVKDWKVNCYLKSGFSKSIEKEGVVSGSVGLDCEESKQDFQSDSAQEEFIPSAASKGKVPRNPRPDATGVCFFRGLRLIGGDLSRQFGGQGIESKEPGDCAVQCYRTDNCKYWVFIEGLKNNCYLKHSFDEEESQNGVTSGSIGYACQ